MKFAISLILITLLSFAACLYLDWWSIAIMSFLVALFIQQSPAMSFLTGFLAIFLLWGGISFWISTSNDHILAHKVSLLILKIDSPYFLILITSLIGGVVGGFAAITASFVRMKKQVHSTNSSSV